MGDLTLERVQALKTPNGYDATIYKSALKVDMMQIFYKLGYDLTIARVQTTDTASNSYVSASRSIQHPDAPPVDGRSRVEVLPSGWVVKPIANGCTVVFIMQLGARAL